MYLYEISSMMHTFGDVKEPKQKSVQLMQAIVQDQMNLLLLEAEKSACIRRGSDISHKDILFLMRKSKIRLKRLLEYLHVLDLKETYSKDLNDEAVTFEDFKFHGKRVEKCLKFLASIEDCNEFTSAMKDETIMDITATKRKMRRYWMTYKMSSEEYDEFSKNSQASFCPLEKFKRWLLKDKVICVGLTDFAVRIIGFLARETIAEIVDTVLIMKMKKLGKYQPLYYDSFLNVVRSLSNLETSDVLELENEKDDHEIDYAVSTAPNNVSSYNQHSRNQVCVNEGDNFKKNEGLNELNSEKSHLSYKVSRRPQLDDHILQKERTECELTHGVVNCKSKEINDEAQCTKVNVNKASNEIESNSLSVSSEKSKKDSSNPMLNNLMDINDDSTDILTFEFPNKDSDMNKKNVPSELSDTDLQYSVTEVFHNSHNPSDSLFHSKNSVQGTPVSGAPYHSQESNLQIQDISDTSDCENLPLEAVATCGHKKSIKRKISSSKHSKKIAQDEAIVNNPTTAKILSDAAQNEVNYINKPIEPTEIKEAFALFQEPSPMALLFASDYIPRRTKLICLAASSPSDMGF